MKLLFDQNLSWRLPKKLADLYPDSQHVREAGMKESEDIDIWEYAKANGYVTDERIVKTLHFIDAHLSENIRLEAIADLIHLSPERARYLIKPQTLG